jgi:hypothetical protein
MPKPTTFFFGGIYNKMFLYFNSFYHAKFMKLYELETAIFSFNHRLMYAISKRLLSFFILEAECFKFFTLVSIKANIIAANNSA